jgi:hypothetical protein
MVNSRHKMILGSGRFLGTSRAQLAAAVDAYLAAGAAAPLVVHFHGGLVSQPAAEAMADRLLPVYQAAGGHPFFVIWQTGLAEQLKNNWQEMVKEDAFPVLVERVLQFVIGKLDQTPGEKGGAVELPSKFVIEDEINQKQAVGEAPFAEREPETASLDADLTAVERAQFAALLESDAALAAAAMKLSRPDAPELNPVLETELAQARAAVEPTEKGLISTSLLVAAGVRILGRTVKRLANGRDHGIYTTIVEEVARELKGDLVGGIIWKHMKKDAADSFAGPSETHGGAALLEELGRIQQAGHTPRLILVGHSAGAVYICHLLEKAATMLPAGLQFEVVLLAPACSFGLLDGALKAADARIARFRSFGMEDELERQDAILPPLYLRSLLYFVSGLLETQVDLPLVGMKRYHAGTSPFDAASFPEIERVGARFAALTSPWIWSESSAGAGLNTLARKHGDFDNDASTLQSVAHLITHGSV